MGVAVNFCLIIINLVYLLDIYLLCIHCRLFGLITFSSLKCFTSR